MLQYITNIGLQAYEEQIGKKSVNTNLMIAIHKLLLTEAHEPTGRKKMGTFQSSNGAK